MKMKLFISAMLAAVLLFTGCIPSRKLSDRNKNALSVYGIALECGEDDAWLRYEGEITGETLDGLWELIAAAEATESVSGGNWFGGFPCLVITGKNGENYTVSCSWDKTEYSQDKYGAPTEEFTGNCMLIRGTRQGKYLIDAATATEFNRLISEALHETTVPTVYESYPNKKARSGNIVFAQVYSNYAFGFQCTADVVDDLGNAYSLDLSLHKDEIIDGGLLGMIQREYDGTDPFRYAAFSAEEMERVRTETAFEIDRTAKVTEKHQSCDFGQKTLYVVDSNGEMIMLRSYGDWDKELQDGTAKKLARLFDKGFYG